MSTHDPQRRNVLRGLLAGGCVLCMPRISHAGIGKASKEQVKYQDQPKGEQKCANCMNFVASNSCKLVEGEISPEGWCTLWAQK